jgi:adenylate cyclase
MAQEIERKFLVIGTPWKNGAEGRRYRQGYLSLERGKTVRVRTDGSRGYLTVKGATTGFTRPEFEYEIPVQDARQMLDQLCYRPIIEKTRYKIEHCGLVWEVDVFERENEGLVLAEVELTDENVEITLPDWVGKEVTGDGRYSNASLVRHPFAGWGPSS